MDETIIKILIEEKEYIDLNHYNMKEAQKYLQNQDGDQFITKKDFLRTIHAKTSFFRRKWKNM